jgi:hypothetical protein
LGEDCVGAGFEIRGGAGHVGLEDGSK